MSGPRISPERLDQLSRFNKIAESTWNLDAILRVASYSSLLGSILLTEQNEGKTTELAGFLAEIFTRMTDARFVNRIGGLPATLESLFSYANDPDHSFLGKLGSIMTWSMVGYYPLEHVWLLSTWKPKFVNIDSDKWSIWSCRFWAVYCVCDVLGTHIRTQNIEKALVKTSDESEKKKMSTQLKYLRIWMTCAICDLIMSLQWSVANGPFSNKQISLIGIYGGLANLYIKWMKSKN